VSNVTNNVSNTNVSSNQVNVSNNSSTLVNQRNASVVGNRFGGPGLRPFIPGQVPVWPGSGGWGSNGAWYGRYHDLHADWYHGSWPSWDYRPARWAATGTAFGWLLSAGQRLAYSNPYYAAPATDVSQSLDYSQPITVSVVQQVQAPTELPTDTDAAPASDTDTAAPDATADAAQQARDLFDQAVASFRDADYATAQATVERAIELLPRDATLHEFRALTLFAQARYRDAAAAQYAVLAAGPGWDWDTLRSFYADRETYTRQLRALERYQRHHPGRADASFLLACHYLTIGANDAAARQLQHTVDVQPEDKLAARMLDVLQQPPDKTDRPRPGA
jgi:tetratricopeptide (TPR) repeat protein